MYCEQCGTASAPDARFCRNCGHNLQAQVIEAAPIPIVESPEIEQPKLAAETSSIQRTESPGDRQEPRLVIEMPEIERPQLAVESASIPRMESLGDRQEPREEVARKSETFLGAHHPWRRVFARAVDMAIAAPFLYLLLFGRFGDAYPIAESLLGTYKSAALLSYPYVTGVLIFVLWTPIEAGFLSAFGATFGKWAFGLRVLDSDDNRLSYGKAFGRAFGVLTYGVGFGIPIVNLLTALYGYYRLEKYGTTVWDAGDATWSVSCRPWTLIGGLTCAFAVFVALMSVALTPPVVIKLSNGYWAGRSALPPIASSPKAAQPADEVQPAVNQTQKDLDEEMRKYRIAAEQGDAVAQYRLGRMFFSMKNYPEALRWLRLSADQGNALGQNWLGNYYSSGHGEPADYKQAVRLYRLAADQGLGRASYSLGLMYLNGEGVRQDKKEYLRHIGLSADQGYSMGFYELGTAYQPRSISLSAVSKEDIKRTVLSYALYNHYCSIEPTDCKPSIAQANRDYAKGRLSDKQVEVGQALTREIARGKPTEVIARYLGR